jgi:hypothetical protein
MLQEVYGNVEMKKLQVYERHKCFRDDRESVNDDLCCRKQCCVK